MDTNSFEGGISVRIAPLGTMDDYTYTVIFCRFEGRWLYCRHRERDVFETAGGRIEPGEDILASAKRELYEETGSIEYTIAPAFDYIVKRNGDESYGQAFFAEIRKLSQMPDFEMAEVLAFDTIPDKMRFPEILPVLFRNIQGWLHRQNAMDELWDVYDSDKNLTGRTQRRGDPRTEGDYHLVAIILLQNSKNELLIVKRSPLISAPNMWAFPGGAVSAGESSLEAAVRETKEETGLNVLPENGKLLHTNKPHAAFGAFFDIWLFRQDFDIKGVVLQEGETTDAKFVSISEISDMQKAGDFSPAAYDEVFAKISLN
ncbi:MAG: NUDIX domain-containing protein [Defluviitaleaceae bacterium]|nr:NUDIX domain-containing protein [Defluviitaleaceae bacterium]